MNVKNASKLITGIDKPRNTPYLYKEITVPKKYESVNILPLGDLHIGSKIHEEELDKLIGWIEKNKNVYVLLLGDLAEFRRFGHRIYTQVLTPDEQIATVKKKFAKLGKQGRILASVPGGHESRPMIEVGLNPARDIAEHLNAEYFEYSGFVELVINKKFRYVIYITHGASGALTKGGKINAMHKLAVTNEADVYCVGHLHDILADTVIRRIVIGGKVQTKKQLFVMTGSWMQYEGSYADEKQYPIGKVGCPKIRLFSKRWDAHLSL